MEMSGRNVIVDIGSEETKLLDVSIEHGAIKIFHAERMTDMSPFVDDGKLVNLTEFVASLKETMQNNGIKCKRLVITSTILGINSELCEKANDSQKVLDASFKQDLAAVNPELELIDYQTYNKYVTENKNSVYSIVAKCSVYVCKSLLGALENAGFTIINVIDHVTPVLNLMKVYHSSYDVQARLFLNIGHTTQLYVVIKDTPVEIKTFPMSFYTLVDSILQQAEIPVLKVKSILNRVGAVRDEQRESELINAGIEPDIYYEIIDEFIEDFRKKLVSQINTWNKLQKYGISNIVVTGGYSDMIGLLEKLQSGMDYNFSPVTINFKFKSKSLNLVNKCNSDVGAAFAPSLGVALSNSYKNSISLRPKRSMIKMSVGVVKKILVVCMFAGLGVAGYGGYNVYNSWLELQRLEAIESETLRMRPTLSRLEQEVDNKTVYLTALQNVDTLLQPLLQYIHSKETETFTVASVDTRDMLVSTSITQDSSIFFLEDSGDDMLMGEDEENSEVQVKSAIVIRGYALTTDEISSFYAGLESLAFTDSLSLKGIESVTLPSEESMYIFEIEIGR